VPGTEPGGLAKNIAHAVSADGRIVVGYCTFDGSPFSTTGFVWTQTTGVVDVNDWLAQQGVLINPNFSIKSLHAMTPDGIQIFGYGQMLTPPYTIKAFRINVPDLVGVPPATPVAGLVLLAPSPNPSSSSTRLDFALPSASSVDLSVFDPSGRRVATLAHGELPAGPRSVTWDGRGTDGRTVTAGVYLARLSTPYGSVVRRIARVD
jgi:uncharacterized membrane protein